jgi:hypothetical protein
MITRVVSSRGLDSFARYRIVIPGTLVNSKKLYSLYSVAWEVVAFRGRSRSRFVAMGKGDAGRASPIRLPELVALHIIAAGRRPERRCHALARRFSHLRECRCALCWPPIGVGTRGYYDKA